MTTIRQVVVIKLFGARGSINTHFIFLKVNPNNPVSSQIIYYVMFYGTLLKSVIIPLLVNHRRFLQL
ncbi:hypothetical protein D6929_13410 [Escherichia coli]|nr:hypothetical protein [Escherichia coli]